MNINMSLNREISKDVVKNVVLSFLSMIFLIYGYDLIQINGYKIGGLMILLSLITLFIKEINFKED